MGESLRRADDERVEGVAWIEPGRARRRDRWWPGLQRGGFVRAQRDDGYVRERVADKTDRQIGSLKLSRSLGDNPCIVFGEPVLEQGIWNPHRYRRAVVRDERGRPKPGVEAMAVHLRLDTAENLVPEVHFSQYSIFHSFFHRCGKLWRETKRAWNQYGWNELREGRRL